MIELNLDASLFCPKLFPLLLDYSNRFEIYKGSAGSGKSYFITQKLIIRACREKVRILVCRRYGTTLRQTVFALFKEVLSKWQLLPFVKIRESDFNISFPNGSEIIFTGLDEETKLLSLTNITVVFIEEVYEVPQNIFEQLNLRLRGGKNQQIIAAFNPISKNSWLYKFCVEEPPQGLLFSETTYKDNPFLSTEYIASLEALKERNPQKYNIYALGLWGVPVEGLVFTRWREEEFDIKELAAQGLERRAGSDLGYIDPTTIVDTFYNRAEGRIYVFNEHYAQGEQLEATARALTAMDLRRQRVYFDSAEPRTIEYFRQQGFNAAPCIKGADSVRARILFLQNHEIIVAPKCTNLINELTNFSYVKDKRTGEYKDNDYTHEFSHLIDALGYAYSDIYTKTKLKTLDKSVLGL